MMPKLKWAIFFSGLAAVIAQTLIIREGLALFGECAHVALRSGEGEGALQCGHRLVGSILPLESEGLLDQHVDEPARSTG